MNSRAIKRVEDVKVIKTIQFAEDAGPMAHPIRPDSYIEMNNFYTVTVYNKGAEVIRMMETILSKSGFNKGLALYFERHDGQAVTCEDFICAMEDANSADLGTFRYWYSQIAMLQSICIGVNQRMCICICLTRFECIFIHYCCSFFHPVT